MAEAQQPLVRDVVDQFMTKQIRGKKSAPVHSVSTEQAHAAPRRPQDLRPTTAGRHSCARRDHRGAEQGPHRKAACR
jgi:hypothetical protein